MKFKGLKSKKLRELNFLEKLSFWWKSPKFFPKFSFLAFTKNLNHWFVFFTLKMVPYSVLYNNFYNCISRKNLVLQLCPKILSINQILAFFDDQYISQLSINTSVFCLQIALEEKRICDYHFYLDLTSCVSCQIRLQDSLMINISGCYPLIP